MPKVNEELVNARVAAQMSSAMRENDEEMYDLQRENMGLLQSLYRNDCGDNCGGGGRRRKRRRTKKKRRRRSTKKKRRRKRKGTKKKRRRRKR